MFRDFWNGRRPALTGLAILAGVGTPAFDAAPVPPIAVPYPDLSHAITQTKSRGAGAGKMTADLRALARQFQVRRGAGGRAYSADQLLSRYGITPGDPDPPVGVAVTLAAGANGNALTQVGGTDFFRVGHVVYGVVPVRALARLAEAPSVAAIAPTKAAALPAPPIRRANPFHRLTRDAQGLPLDFDHQGMTGRGVVLGVVDSGIAWHHADFRRADGSTRILALWDMTDDSFATSGGRIGSRPPASVNGKPLGTLYTQAQIDAALQGKGTVASGDQEGHGTACAGVAAGNGLAPGHWIGVAPDADLVIVRAGSQDHIAGDYLLGTRWISQTAKAHHEPCVISQSFGSQDGPHDGSSADETALDDLSGTGKPGVVICAAAGNEGQESLHASGRFGPRQTGQADVESDPVELFITKDTELDAFFDDADEWGLGVVGLDNFLVSTDGSPDALLVVHIGGHVKGGLKQEAKAPADFRTYFETLGIESAPGGREDHVTVPLPAGHYLIMGFGATAKVTDGAFNLYLPFPHDASFGHGADRRFMISSPGNADGVITVGAYNVRRAWTSRSGQPTAYNLVLGDIAAYSNPGFRRGGVVKPDLCAPGSFAISALAPDSALAQGNDGKPDATHITADGQHLAWEGTSAATPYAAGVIALMLQKNPTLDETQVRQILSRTAGHDDLTGAVPNPQWGYGRLDPAAALKATPVGNRSSPQSTPSRSSRPVPASFSGPYLLGRRL